MLYKKTLFVIKNIYINNFVMYAFESKGSLDKKNFIRYIFAKYLTNKGCYIKNSKD